MKHIKVEKFIYIWLFHKIGRKPNFEVIKFYCNILIVHIDLNMIVIYP